MTIGSVLTVIELLILVVFAVLGYTGYRLLSKKREGKQRSPGATVAGIILLVIGIGGGLVLCVDLFIL